MTGILCLQAESGQGVGYDIRGCRQIFTGSCCQAHDAVDTGNHITGFPACHGHILESRCGLGCGELCLGTHLAGFIPEGLQVFSGRTRNGGDL